MARATFGGTSADFVMVVGPAGQVRVIPATLTMWTAETGGTQVTDLLLDGSPVSTISVGSDGQVPVFEGPDGLGTLWASAGGADRVRLVPDRTTADLASDATVGAYVADDNSATRTALNAAIAGSGLVGPTASVVPGAPEDLAWDWATYGFTFTLTTRPDGTTVAKASKRGRDFFDAVSTARTAPSATFYVNGSTAQTVGGIAFSAGSDSNAGTSASAPFASIYKAIQAANTAAVPSRVYVATGTYGRLLRPSQTSAAPTSDVALIAVGGRVTTGSWDDKSFARDSTYPNCFTTTVTDCAGVALTDRRTNDGHYAELAASVGRTLTKGSTTSGSARITNAGGGDPNGVGFTSDDIGRIVTGTGIPDGSVVAGVVTVTAAFLVQKSTQATRQIVLTSGSTTVTGTFTSDDVGKSIAGTGIPAEGASAAVPNTIVSQTGTAAVIAKAAAASGTVTATVATLATATATDSSGTVAFTLSSTPSDVNAAPGTYLMYGGTLYVNRGDGVLPISANTRVYRSVSDVLRLTSSVNVFVGGADEASGWDFEGGTTATLNANLASDPGSGKVLAAENSTFRYAASLDTGSGTLTTGRGVNPNSWRRLAVFDNCDASANASDGFNAHNQVSAARSCFMLTINCTGINNGRRPQTSCNGYTLHEDMVAIDLAGHYERGHGGTVRNIGTSQMWAVGTAAADDLGDRAWGGTQAPTALEADDQAEVWADRPLVRMPAGRRGFVATSTAKIHTRNAWPTGTRDYAQSGALIDTF